MFQQEFHSAWTTCLLALLQFRLQACWRQWKSLTPAALETLLNEYLSFTQREFAAEWEISTTYAFYCHKRQQSCRSWLPLLLHYLAHNNGGQLANNNCGMRVPKQADAVLSLWIGILLPVLDYWRSSYLYKWRQWEISSPLWMSEVMSCMVGWIIMKRWSCRVGTGYS